MIIRASTTVFAMAALVAAVAAAACGGGGTKTAAGTAVPCTPGSGAAGVTTSIPEVDHIIDAAMKCNAIEMAALTGYQKIACKPGAPDTGTVPRCRDTEHAGEDVEVLASSGCGDAWVRPEQTPHAYQEALSGGAPSVYAVYAPASRSNPFKVDFGDQYVVVLRAGTPPDGTPSGVALHTRNGRIVWLETSCDALTQLVSKDRVQSYIIEPKSRAATPAAAGTLAPGR